MDVDLLRCQLLKYLVVAKLTVRMFIWLDVVFGFYMWVEHM